MISELIIIKVCVGTTESSQYLKADELSGGLIVGDISMGESIHWDNPRSSASTRPATEVHAAISQQTINTTKVIHCHNVYNISYNIACNLWWVDTIQFNFTAEDQSVQSVKLNKIGSVQLYHVTRLFLFDQIHYYSINEQL